MQYAADHRMRKRTTPLTRWMLALNIRHSSVVAAQKEQGRWSPSVIKISIGMDTTPTNKPQYQYLRESFRQIEPQGTILIPT